MPYRPKFCGWKHLNIRDMLVAYRKAKADCFFENTFPISDKFSEYEQNLYDNLTSLLEKLQCDEGFANDSMLLGKLRIIPKNLELKDKPDLEKSHIHISDPKRNFQSIVRTKDIKPSFRIIGDFPVQAHIISALWINTIGHKFDSCLSDNCYGSRLKRIHDDQDLCNNSENPFHITSIGSFYPYFRPYQNWRNNGLKAIRNELENGHAIIAVSLDIKSYYHLIDPRAIEKEELHNKLGLKDSKKLSPEEQAFTKEIASFLHKWSNKARTFAKQLTNNSKNQIPGGLAIGISASRIISNILLHQWDQLIKERITPIYYGRYVDDMFLVMHDTGDINSIDDLMHLLSKRLTNDTFRKKHPTNNDWSINLGKPIQGNSKIYLQPNKQKLFILDGQAGIDLLDSIEKDINELSSEHRLMPSPDQLEHSTAARVLSAAGNVGEQADTLRRADGLTIRRLSWSLQLRHVETLANDLPKTSWKKQREEFYEFSHNHILRPDSLFSYFTHLPRLLGFAVGLNEWSQASCIVKKAFDCIEQLEKAIPRENTIVVNGEETIASEDIWKHLRESLILMFIDASVRYYDPNLLSKKEYSEKTPHLENLFNNHRNSFMDTLKIFFDDDGFYRKALLILTADMAKIPYKEAIKRNIAIELFKVQNKAESRNMLNLLNKDSGGMVDTESLKEFLKNSKKQRLITTKKDDRNLESYLPYLFPTRPYTPAEIAELSPACVGFKYEETASHKASTLWAKYTQAIRGVWIKPTLLATQQEKTIKDKSSHPSKIILNIGTEKKDKVIIAITNIKTTDNDWSASASDEPRLTLERYKKIANLVNQVIKIKPSPDYVVFPELSIPLYWVKSIANKLSSAGISLIAGTEYRHFRNKKIRSEAYLVLADNRLGFPAWVTIWQPKLEPAASEDMELISKFGKIWQHSSHSKKPIYNHNGFRFGVMVCSELQNSKERISFQGEVDALMVLAWNQDLETFSSLIESAALDIHAYTILVNNRRYGDSRVRSPAKESFMRDLARVRGGDNDFVVAVTLDIKNLRAFQSRAKRWPTDTDLFKPIPEGYNISPARKIFPPK